MGRPVEEREEDTGTRVKNRVPEGQQWSLEIKQHGWGKLDEILQGMEGHQPFSC